MSRERLEEEISYFMERAEQLFTEQKYEEATTLCSDILQADANHSSALFLRARSRYMTICQGERESASNTLKQARQDLMAAFSMSREIFLQAEREPVLRPLFIPVFQNVHLPEIKLAEECNRKYCPCKEEITLEHLQSGIIWPEVQDWDLYVKSVYGYIPDKSQPGGLYADPVPELLKGFFETRKELLHPLLEEPDKERLAFLGSHRFLSFRDSSIERTHSYGHLCEANIFSPEEYDTNDRNGATSIALYRMEFDYLSSGLELPQDLYESWKESVFTSWRYFCLPDLLPDLRTITGREPESAEAWFYLAECSLAQGRAHQAESMTAYKRFIELKRDAKPPLNNHFISENFSKYYSFKPSVMEAYGGIAYLLLMEGDLQGYEESLLKAIEADRYHHAAPYLELAYLYFLTGRAFDALKYTVIYEDVFEARVRSFDFSKDFFGGNPLSRKPESNYHSGSTNFKDNSYMTDCLLVNRSRLQWRFRKYSYLAISLTGLSERESRHEGHKNRFQVSYKDIRTLISNFYLNILNVIGPPNKEEGPWYHYDKWALLKKGLSCQSYTWESFAGLKRFDRQEQIELELRLTDNPHCALDRVEELLKESPDNRFLLEYKRNLKEEISWME